MIVKSVVFFLVITIASAQYLFAGDDCYMKDGTIGACESIRTCAWFKKNLELKLMDYKDTVRCGFDKETPIICCSNEKPVADSIITTKSGSRPSEAACESFPKYEESELSDHIVGGAIVEVGEFPFMAGLGYQSTKQNEEYSWNCGASLISSRHLLTAAHCVSRDNPPLIARLGTRAVYGAEEEDALKQDFSIKNIIVNDKYRGGRKYNDIAVIELNKDVEITETVSPACLYLDREDLPPSTVLSAEGWGVMETKKFKKSTFLQKTNMSTVALPQCKVQLETILHNHPKLPSGLLESQLCAIGEMTQGNIFGDTCKGDSGGPLNMLYNNKYHIVGVTSFGHGCGTDKPSLYTRVAYYLDWIESIVWAEN